MKKSHTLRILLALLVIFGAFAYIVYGLAQLQLVKGEGCAASAVEGLGVAAAHATGDKCERCWKYSADIGTHAAHPTLCARCAAVVEG